MRGMEACVQVAGQQRVAARRSPGRTWPASSRRRRPACRRTASRAPSPPACRGRASSQRLRQRAADAVPAGQAGAVLRPGEHPGNRPQRRPTSPSTARACSGANRCAGARSRRSAWRRGSRPGNPGPRGPARGSGRARWPRARWRSRASSPRAVPADAAAGSRAAPRRWPAPGCAARSRGCRTCGGSPRPARSGAGSRRPSRAARRSPRVRSCRHRG